MINDLNITVASQDDVPAILAIRRITWLATYPDDKYGITYSDIEEHLDKKDRGAAKIWRRRMETGVKSRTWIARIRSGIVGFVSARKGDSCNQLMALYVHPEYQGQGVGTVLMDEALKWLGVKQKIKLEVVSYNTAAIGFYGKFGFSVIGPCKGMSGILSGGKHLPETEMMKNP